MKSDRYISVDVIRCRDSGHRLTTAWSDKNPAKVSLICTTCSESTGKSAYAGYGDDTKSLGQWRALRFRKPPEFTPEESTDDRE